MKSRQNLSLKKTTASSRENDVDDDHNRRNLDFHFFS